MKSCWRWPGQARKVARVVSTAITVSASAIGYALFPAAAYIRAAASRAGVPVPQACQNLAPEPSRETRAVLLSWMVG